MRSNMRKKQWEMFGRNREVNNDLCILFWLWSYDFCQSFIVFGFIDFNLGIGKSRKKFFKMHILCEKGWSFFSYKISKVFWWIWSSSNRYNIKLTIIFANICKWRKEVSLREISGSSEEDKEGVWHIFISSNRYEIFLPCHFEHRYVLRNNRVIPG